MQNDRLMSQNYINTNEFITLAKLASDYVYLLVII